MIGGVTIWEIVCYFFEHNLSNGNICNYFYWFKFLEPTSLGLGGFLSFPVTRACISAKHVSNFWWNGRKSLVANWSWSFRPFSNIVTYNDRMFAEKSKSDTKSGKREKSPVQMDVTLLANNSHTMDVTCCVCLHSLLHVVGSCWTKFETGQAFDPATPNISLVPWSPKRSATTLDPFLQPCQHG